MELIAGATRIFDNDALVPDNWRARRSDGFRVFNPTLLHRSDDYITMVYRVVSQTLGRKIALCQLDDRLNVIRGSIKPLSDLIEPATETWHADPRFCQLDGEPHLYWNDGYRMPHNNQFVVAFDPERMVPKGKPLLLDIAGPRQPIEKNWGLFYSNGIKAVYSAEPLRILTLDRRSHNTLMFSDAPASTESVGDGDMVGIRGGASPTLHAGRFYCFGHIVSHSKSGMRNYHTAVYAFDATQGWGAGLCRASRTLALPNPFGEDTFYPRLNGRTGAVVYICGAVPLDQGWLLSYGINDERCALHFMSHQQVNAHMIEP